MPHPTLFYTTHIAKGQYALTESFLSSIAKEIIFNISEISKKELITGSKLFLDLLAEVIVTVVSRSTDDWVRKEKQETRIFCHQRRLWTIGWTSI